VSQVNPPSSKQIVNSFALGKVNIELSATPMQTAKVESLNHYMRTLSSLKYTSFEKFYRFIQCASDLCVRIPLSPHELQDAKS